MVSGGFGNSQRAVHAQYRSKLGLVYRIGDGACVILALLGISALSRYPWHDAHWQPLYLLAASVAVGLFYVIAEYQGLYVAARGLSRRQELLRIWGVWLGVLLLLLLLGYGVKMTGDYPRRVMLAWFVGAPALLSGWRMGVSAVLRHLRSRGYNQQQVAVVGVGEAARRVAENIVQAPWSGLRLLGFFADQAPLQQQPFASVDARLLGTVDQLMDRVRAGEVDAVYIALPGDQEAKVEGLVNALADTMADVYVIPNLFMQDLLHARWLNLNGVPVINVFETPFYGVDGTVKRLVDVVLSAGILAVIALPMAAIAVAIRLTSPGPAIFKQRRYGLDGREIVVWKFRTMTVCEDGAQFTQAQRNDPRVTPIGAFLRRHSLDELPQFINVLQGRMSIVGPRPHPVALNEQHRRLIQGYMLRHRVRPGITGWAQVNGARGETETLEKMQARIDYDLAYIRNWTLWLDFRIIGRTVINGFFDKNAY